MTAQEFREMALRLDGAVESSHMDHPDFRVNGRIFATLGSPDAAHGMVKLAAEDQRYAVASAPEVFVPAAGAWGRQGSTLVRLAAATPEQLGEYLTLAWKLARAQGRSKPAPKRKSV